MDLKIDNKQLENTPKRARKTKEKYPSEQAFAADLARENLTETELLDLYITQIKESYLSQQLIEIYVKTKVKVTEEEMLSFYETSKDSLAVKPITWKTGAIIHEIKPSKASEEAKLAEMKAIQDRLNQGADFASLAMEVSDCPSKERGGDLGFFSRGMMVKPFEEAAFALNAGQVSPIVQTEFGYHLIKVEEKRDNEVRARHILKISHPARQPDAFQMMESAVKGLTPGRKVLPTWPPSIQTKESAANGGIIGDGG